MNETLDIWVVVDEISDEIVSTYGAESGAEKEAANSDRFYVEKRTIRKIKPKA